MTNPPTQSEAQVAQWRSAFEADAHCSTPNLSRDSIHGNYLVAGLEDRWQGYLTAKRHPPSAVEGGAMAWITKADARRLADGGYWQVTAITDNSIYPAHDVPIYLHPLHPQQSVAINEFNRAINFAIELGVEAREFLQAWREGAWDILQEEWNYAPPHSVGQKDELK